MAGAYSQDLRKRVIATIEAGASRRTAASRFAVSVSTVVNWRRRWLDTGTAAAKPMGGATNTRIKDEDAAWLLALVGAQDDLTAPAAAIDPGILDELSRDIEAFAGWYAQCGVEEEDTANVIDDLQQFKVLVDEARKGP